MLGDSGSGKTCYMLAMYAAMQMGDHGFTITTVDPDENVRLNNLWANLISTVGSRRWPDKTNQMKTYKFEFSEGLDSSIRFEWLDYRGGALSQESASDSDIVELRNQILQSSGLFFCISGEHLREKITAGSLPKVIVESKARFMTDYLVHLRKRVKREERQYFPIIITVSKYDLCYDRPKEELLEDIKKVFKPVFAEHTHWLVMICPVSLGKGLAFDKHSSKIIPKNLHLPLIFALYCKLGEIRKRQNEMYKNNDEILDKLLNSSAFTRIAQGSKIANLEKKLENIDKYREQINHLMKRIVVELKKQNADIYYNGQEIDFNFKLED